MIMIQLDVFNEKIPIGYLNNTVLVFAIIVLSTHAVDRIRGTNKRDARPFVYCPVCADAKMMSEKWTCERCGGTFQN